MRHSFLSRIDPPCHAACDSNGDGKFAGQIVDPIYLLRFLFMQDSPPPSPFPECGTDPEGALDCRVYPACR